MSKRREEEKLYHSITNINDEFIAEMMEESSHKVLVKKKRIRYLIPLAACFILVLSAISVLAETGMRTQLIEMFTSRKQSDDYSESGYDLLVDVKAIPTDQLGEVKQVSETILEQIKNYKPWDSRDPHTWYKEYVTSGEAVAFIGLKSLNVLNWDLQEEGTVLTVYGNADGEICFVQMETDYKSNDIRLQAFSNIYLDKLDNFEGNIKYGVRTTEDVSYTEEYYTTAHEERCQILTSTALESGYFCKEGYLVKDGILYSLNIAYQEEDAKQAEKLMYQWADLF